MSGHQQAGPLGIQPSRQAEAAGSLLKTQSDEHRLNSGLVQVNVRVQ